jgi:hypothetical protein
MLVDRRSAIRNILLAYAGTVFLPGLSLAKASSFFINGKISLNKDYEQYLSQICETFLPIENISKKTRNPEIFIQKIVNHTLRAEEIEQFVNGFDRYVQLMEESHLQVKSTEAAKVIPFLKTTLSSADLHQDLAFFINTTRSLSIRSFTSSEYYMTEYLKYKLIPNKYDGCKEVSEIE